MIKKKEKGETMYIAVVTGASSGLGMEFALQIDKRYELDEIWLIARREERLLNLGKRLKAKVKIFPLDLSQNQSLDVIRYALEENKPQIKLLVNAAGFGKFGTVEALSLEDQTDMINVNITALTGITKLCIPFLTYGAGIINMSSVSGFIPLPYLNVYSASKAYVLNFSKALSYELKDKGVRVTAVCPYWVATEFIPTASDSPMGDCINNFKLISYPFTVTKKALELNGKNKITALTGAVPCIIKFLAKTLPLKIQFLIWDSVRKLNNQQYSQQFPEQ